MIFIRTFRFNQIFAALAVNFGGVGVGMALAWSGTALTSLEEAGQVGLLTSSDKSWIASLVNVGALLACPLTGKLLNKVGRRGSLIIVSIVTIPGWGLLIWASSPVHLFVGRVLCGICVGGFSVTVPVYIREISSKENRGLLGSFFFFGICLGKVFSNAVGIVYSASLASALCGLQPILYIIFLLLIPESPTFLVQKSMKNEAVEGLTWLQHKGLSVPFPCFRFVINDEPPSPPPEILAEVELIQQEQQERPKSSISCGRILSSSGELRKPCITAFILFALSELCGISVMTSYTVKIFQMIGNGVLEPKVSTVVLSILQTFGCIPASLFVDRFGRKSLFLSSFAATALALTSISGFFYVRQFQPSILENNSQLEYVPLVSILVFYLAYSWGIGNVVYVTLCEILPPEIVGPATAAGNLLNWTSAFVITQTFEMFNEWVPPFVWFAIYASVCFFGFFYTLAFLPETKGLSLGEIQDFYRSPRKRVGNQNEMS